MERFSWVVLVCWVCWFAGLLVLPILLVFWFCWFIRGHPGFFRGHLRFFSFWFLVSGFWFLGLRLSVRLEAPRTVTIRMPPVSNARIASFLPSATEMVY